MLYDIDIPQYAWYEFCGGILPIEHAVTFSILKKMDHLMDEEYQCEDDYTIITVEQIYDFCPMLEYSHEVERQDPMERTARILRDLARHEMIKYDSSELTEAEAKRIGNERCLGKVKLLPKSDNLYSDFSGFEYKENDEIEDGDDDAERAA
jgi:hypothetical protein